MEQIRISIFVFITLCCAAGVLAQKKINGIRQPVFSSVYSDIAKGKSCKMIEEEIVRCRPVGNYRLFAGFHNVTESVWIETLDGEEVAGKFLRSNNRSFRETPENLNGVWQTESHLPSSPGLNFIRRKISKRTEICRRTEANSLKF